MPLPENKIRSLSFVLIALCLILGGYLGITAQVLTVLFSYLLLDSFERVLQRRWLAMAAFLVLLAGLIWSAVWLWNLGAPGFPQAASEMVTALVSESGRWGFTLPFSDLEGLKASMLNWAGGPTAALAYWSAAAARQVTLFFISVTVAISMFLGRELDIDRGNHKLRFNLYSGLCQELSRRFRRLYASFRAVMGAQLVISAINSVLTCFLILLLKVPYPVPVVVVTFLLGLLPTIGGVLSNTITCAVALSVSPRLALECLAGLVALHRLEYLINVKIIGARIRNPMFLTLASLVVGERLLGVPGIILAPVILHYLKTEACEIPIMKGLALVVNSSESRSPQDKSTTVTGT